jgi:hypothetical protein
MIYTAPVCTGSTFDAGKSITRASGTGLGPGNQDFFGPCEMASSFSGTYLLPLAQAMDLPASKLQKHYWYVPAIPIRTEVQGSFMYTSFRAQKSLPPHSSYGRLDGGGGGAEVNNILPATLRSTDSVQ